MDLELAGKTAVVTGASRGIGLAVVRTLIDEGMRVVAGSRTITPELKDTGAVAVSANLATAEGTHELVQRALTELDEIDVLVNNVGGGDVEHMGSVTSGFGGTTDDTWLQMWELNFLSAVRMTREALPSLLRRGGAVINISSMGAVAPQNGPLPYTTAKAALNALGKALAEELGPQGVRVNTVSPGPTRTPIWEDPAGVGGVMAELMGMSHEEMLRSLPSASGMILDRLTEPAEIASVVAFLASPRAASVFGSNYAMDGGSVKAL